MLRRIVFFLLVTSLGLLRLSTAARSAETPAVMPIDPPENGFFSKRLDYEGIPIKAHKDVADEALYQGRARLAMMLDKLPEVHRRLQKAGAELHIIGRSQVTSDLPEFRRMKGKPFDGKKTIDERTRGMGGLLTSCGEENLLRLEVDRYRGRDICVHEFAHNIQDNGMTAVPRARIRQQHQRSLAKGLWKGSYAGSNEHEFFAELSMWYWGTHGDLHMEGKKPDNGREGLKAYDPDGCALLDDLYNGRLEATAVTAEEAQVAVVPRPDTAQSNPYYPGNRPPLVPSPFIRLPTGSVKPKGWLRRQLELQAEGYLGHMGEVSGFLNKANNAWLDTAGKGGCFWEEVPYWLRGYVSLAYLLEDPKRIDEARLWLEPSLKGQRPNGYFGTQALAGDATHAPDLMPHQNML
jgi:hypothetical protein